MSKTLIALVIFTYALSTPASVSALTPIIKDGSIFEKLKCGKGGQFDRKTRKCRTGNPKPLRLAA